MFRCVPAALLIAMTGSLLTSCAANKSVVPTGILEADKYLFERGTELLGRKKWLQSREYFRQIVDNYPQSAYRPDAKLGLGDSYLGEGTAEALVFAQNEFKEFLTFFPTNARADYAQYKMGLTHNHQMPAADRDQTETKQAVIEFALFLQRYPNSPLLGEVKAKLRESRNRLSESDYKVGFFYWRGRWYPGAIDRFRSVLTNDPEYTNRDAVYFHLADCFVKVGNPAQALPYYDKLIAEFEKSEYLVAAQNASASIKAQMASLMKK
ncbi:MAG: outer membrane protein assembly factor BamD [Acidobacteria bacterium]|nr:outer membrane protein assembly factor BamD [Acidobacteriota bacterium]